MTKKESFMTRFEKALGGPKVISYVFLGVGLTLFLMNITSFLSFLPKNYSHLAFDISVFSSMLLILLSMYMIHREK